MLLAPSHLERAVEEEEDALQPTPPTPIPQPGRNAPYTDVPGAQSLDNKTRRSVSLSGPSGGP